VKGDQKPSTSYAAAGVDIEAGDRAVSLMKEWVGKTALTCVCSCPPRVLPEPPM
jgi:phosphoribosylaminoimidazole (AIR) synthetase